MTVASVDSAAAIRARILDASARGTRLRVVGRGAWLDAGRPVRATESIATDGLTGIVEYVPGDLVLTARAGTTLGEIRAATAANGQWLALDPHGGDDATLGATAATGSSGPLATSFGRPRDLVLGVEFVTGTGAVSRGGGRVVKNVAGFDLTRLMCGSWGTLGVITEVTVRLHARPACDETLAIAIDDETGPARVRRLLRRLPFTPYACEVLNDTLAGLLLGRTEVTAIARVGGNEESVEAQRAAFAELGDVRSIENGVWERLRTCEPPGAQVFRLSRLPSEIERTWNDALALARQCRGTMVHATAARGVVRCIVPNDAPDALLEAFGAPTDAKRVGERLTTDLWRLLTPPASEIARRIKSAFDPRSILNPGILGETA